MALKVGDWYGFSTDAIIKSINFAKNNGIKIAVNPGHDRLFKDLEILKSLLDKIYNGGC